MKIGLKYKNEEHIFDECISAGVPFLKYPILEKEGLVEHGISTRLGGVSEGFLGSMNLSYTRGDDPAHVDENYRRMAAAIGVKPEHMVCTHQTHTTNVRIVTREDAGKGVTREKDYTDVDGLITNVPGICLVTFYADCVPLLFLDPVKKVVASSHSGWRGTVNRMGQVTVEKMQKEFSCDPKNILACVGPSIRNTKKSIFRHFFNCCSWENFCLVHFLCKWFYFVFCEFFKQSSRHFVFLI